METEAASDSVTIEDLNAEEAKVYMGGTILICILSITGVIGNIHVLVVYIFRMKQSNHRVFIICLAFLDLITCVVGMPFVVTNLLRPFMFYDTTLCKILTFYNFFICISSAGILIVISVDRYRKICIPLGKQMSQTVAMAMCMVSMGASLMLSWPGLVLYGSSPLPTSHPDIVGYECNVLAELKETNYPIYFNGALLFVSVSSFIVLAVLYSIIGKVIWNHRVFRQQSEEVNTEFTNMQMSDTHTSVNPPEPNFHSGSSDSNEYTQASEADDKTDTPRKSDMTETLDNPRKMSSNIDQRRRSSIVGQRRKSKTLTSAQRASNKFDRTKRTTMMLFWITIIFFISYIPYLVLRIVSYMNPQWYPGMSYGGKVTYNTVLWCVYINNMANSIIYGFCDQRFRNEIILGYRKIFRCN